MIIPKNLPTAEQQYLNLLRYIMEHGYDILNERTGKVCRTAVGATLYYNVGGGEFPMVTTRKAYWRKAIREFIGYLRAYTSAAEFRALGTDTWDGNANGTKAWLENLNRKGEDDIGITYGAVAKNWPKYDGTTIDTFRKVYENLKRGIDDRGEIITFWNPGLFELGALRPCMHTHTFSLLGDTLHLTSKQRSWDGALGGTFNSIQCYFFLEAMAHITGHKPGWVKHDIDNAHIYDNHFEGVTEQLGRDPYDPPQVLWKKKPTDWDDLITNITDHDLELVGYQHHPAIKFDMAT